MTIINYDGGSEIFGLPSRGDYIVENLDTRGTLRFMPVNVVDNYKADYKLHLFGPYENGNKGHVIVSKIRPYFNIRKHNKKDISEFLDDKGIIHTTRDYVSRKGIGYAKPENFIRVEVNTIEDLKSSIKIAIDEGFTTMNDEEGDYYKKVAREYKLPLSDWIRMKNSYTKKDDGNCE